MRPRHRNNKPFPILNDPFKIPLNSPPNDPIETSIPFTLTSAQKDNIDAILDEQVVFNRNGEVCRTLAVERNDPRLISGSFLF